MTPAIATEVQNDVEIHGTCDDRFQLVREVFARNLQSGEDLGASAAVYIDGEPVVDIWGGYLDNSKIRPWEKDTIVNVFSTTKTMTALCALMLVDRGLLDLEAPVAKYWPEFAANGKAQVKVRHLLSHSSGLPGWTEQVTLADILDREKAVQLLERQAPWWEPGTAIGYHAITFGPLIGEVIRRITGKTLGQFFAEEVAGPLGADFHIGTPPEKDAQVTDLIQSLPFLNPTGTNSIPDRVFFNPYVRPQDSFTIAWRRGELGGSNGHGNARSVAAAQSVLSAGGRVRGVTLLSRTGCERALEMQFEGTDLVAGYPLKWGLGFSLESQAMVSIFGPHIKGQRIACWGGSGGSFVMNDFDRRMTVAFVMNKHVEHGGLDHRAVDVIRAAYESLFGPSADANNRSELPTFLVGSKK